VSRSSRALERFSFGGRVPWSVGLLIVVTIVSSLVVAFGSRHTTPLFEHVALSPDLVLTGQAWRLVTWGVVETSPLSLLFVVILFYWFGKDLAEEWGSRRFLAVYAALAVAAAVVTCLVALLDPGVRHEQYLGSFPLACALTVAWGLWFPDRTILVFFVLRLKGFWLAMITLGLSVAYVAYLGWERYVPLLVAEGGMLAWLFRRSFVARWSAWSRARRESARAEKRREADAKRRSSEAALRAMEEREKAQRDDEDLPPLPKELEAVLGLGKDKGRKPE